VVEVFPKTCPILIPQFIIGALAPLVKNGGKQFYEYGFHVVNEWVGHAHKRVLFVFSFLFFLGEVNLIKLQA
jgi:hypothetical protein